MLKNKDLLAWFDEFNHDVFGGKLKPVRIRAQYVGPGIMGLCWGTEVHIKDTLDFQAARCTLLHEMIHVWQFQQGLEMDHGRLFKHWQLLGYDSTGLWA